MRNSRFTRTLWSILANAVLCGMLLHVDPVLADDTEIYTASSAANVQPNILFLIDASASMSIGLKFGAPYDPTKTYTGPCTDYTKLYWKSSGVVPTCSSTDSFIYAVNYKCAAAQAAFNTAGYYVDHMSEWIQSSVATSSTWNTGLTNLGSTANRMVECAADDGLNGQTAGDSKVYAAISTSGPWTANATDPNRLGSSGWTAKTTYTMFTPNYVNWYATVGSIYTRKIDAIKNALTGFLQSVNNVNVGIAQLSMNSNGGMVLYPISDIAANRTNLLNTVAAIDAPTSGAGTPLSEATWEMLNYFIGNPVKFGTYSTAWRSGANVTLPSISSSRQTSNQNLYLSPESIACAHCIIVIMTDGEPTYDDQADGYINALPNFKAVTGENCAYLAGPPTTDCIVDLAYYMHKVDINPTLAGTQSITTYTVGVNINDPMLSAAAVKGGGKYFYVTNSAALSSALTQITIDVLAINSSFTAPAVSVNVFNRTQQNNELYFTMFKPGSAPHWDGNLKKYQLGLDANGAVQIMDANNVPAVDPNTGFFKDTSLSLWTNAAGGPDGQETALGGAASKLTTTRHTYTWLGLSNDLTSAGNALNENNSAITAAMIGAASSTARTTDLQWIRGVDTDDSNGNGSTTDARQQIGDPLHTKPVVVVYDGTKTPADSTVYFSENDGYLHAVSTIDGTEQFAFMPSDLLVNIDTLHGGIGPKVYGLDGPLSAVVSDADGDGIINAANGDSVELVTGMRRGGRNYYALDVTNRSVPKMLWTIKGGTSQYAELGQTWSQPTPTKIMWNGQVTPVLIFGGGYDAAEDTVTNTVDTMGRALYIVNAQTGARIWWAGPASSGADLQSSMMTNSFPADLKVLDMNADGLADRIYAVDVGGKLWRFDINNGASTAASLVTGGAIAQLGQGGVSPATLSQNRRFFYAPDVVLVPDQAHGNYLAINVGSGYRSHPLDVNIQDMFFSIRDPNVMTVPASYNYGITLTNLYNATSDILGTGTSTDITAAQVQLFGSDKGWYITLGAGEKVLASSVTFNNGILFTTYTPASAAFNSTSCASNAGLGRLYYVSVADATPKSNFDPTTVSLTAGDRSIQLNHSGIPADVSILFPAASQGKPQVFVGPEKAPVDFSNKRVVKTYWFDSAQ